MNINNQLTVKNNIYIIYSTNIKKALLVQLVERRFPKPDVEGSSPSGRDLLRNLFWYNIINYAWRGG